MNKSGRGSGIIEGMDDISQEHRLKKSANSKGSNIHTNPTLTAINTAILTDTTLSDNAKHALIELMRVAYKAMVSRASLRPA